MTINEQRRTLDFFFIFFQAFYSPRLRIREVAPLQLANRTSSSLIRIESMARMARVQVYSLKMLIFLMQLMMSMKE